MRIRKNIKGIPSFGTQFVWRSYFTPSRSPTARLNTPVMIEVLRDGTVMTHYKTQRDELERGNV